MKIRRALRLLMERFVPVEVIGQEECPLMLRWEFFDLGFVKAMVHYFPAEVTDRDPHDHPRPFFTFVLRGGYWDTSWKWTDSKAAPLSHPKKEWVSRGAFRYRPARHLHVVETAERGCWTIVLMGPLVREWGFVRMDGSGAWWPWGKYIQRFGGVIRCDSEPDRMGAVEAEDDCYSCGEEMPLNECPASKRPCGHHCNCAWVHDRCHWCGREFGEESP